MSQYYDHYHRWEPLAEFNFIIDEAGDLFDDENYIYCLCSRAFIRNTGKTYYAEKEIMSDSELQNLHVTQEYEDQSHVHFSVDPLHENKTERDEGTSCYCSASHTENYWSTDEHDTVQISGTLSNALHPSDSGADLTYPDSHFENVHHKVDEKNTDQNVYYENYLSEGTWEKFWAINGERLIWASWIEKYSDYINPDYLDQNNEMVSYESNPPKEHSTEPICGTDGNNKLRNYDGKLENTNDTVRVRKYSYDSKIDVYKNISTDKKGTDNLLNSTDKENDIWVPIGRRRSCSEHDRIISPKTVLGSASLTNVTKITASSFDTYLSHVTSDSAPTDDYSISSSTTDDPSNGQTRIANLEYTSEDTPLDDLDTEQYWQFLWKKHFGDQYALHYANYVENQQKKSNELPIVNIEVDQEKLVLANVVSQCDTNKKIILVDKDNKYKKNQEHACNNEGNMLQESLTTEVESSDITDSDLITSIHVPEKKNAKIRKENALQENSQFEVIKVQTDSDEKEVREKGGKSKKKTKKPSNRYLGSIGVLLQNLIKEEQKNGYKTAGNHLTETKNSTNNETETVPSKASNVSSNFRQSVNNPGFSSYKSNDGGDEPPEEKKVTLKRSHEIDDEDVAEKIKDTLNVMGFCIHSDKIPKGELVYKKRIVRLRPPRAKCFGVNKKTYFDEESNPYESQNSHDETQGAEDTPSDSKLIPDNYSADISCEGPSKNCVENAIVAPESSKYLKNVAIEAAMVPLPLDSDSCFSDKGENCDTEQKSSGDIITNTDSTKRRKRNRRNLKVKTDIPDELKGNTKMLKYWKRRHSLFHKFDEGVKLDQESWFSVTPENVARHHATKCTYDVVVDAFCGAGGNTIQFALTSKKVIAIDIDPVKIEMAKHNATVYGVEDRIEFRVGDFFELAGDLCADMIFLSPPWGGPDYSSKKEYDIETMLAPKPASQLMEAARNVSNNITFYLPKNTRTDQILSIAKEMCCSVEIEQNYLDRRFVAITAYFY